MALSVCTFRLGEVVMGRAYREHGFLRREFGELGVEVLALFRGKEAVQVGLAFADDVGHRALEGAGHAAEAAAEAAADHVCHVGGMDREVGDWGGGGSRTVLLAFGEVLG